MKVLITKPVPLNWIKPIIDHQIGYEFWEEERSLNGEELVKKLKDFDLLLNIGTTKLDQSIFENSKHLKGIALMSVGYDHVDIVSATKAKIPVSNTPDVLSGATADTAFLLMLAVSRDAFMHHKRIEKGDWKHFSPTANLGQELNGKTLGIFGLGRIGIEMAKKSIGAYGMKIIYHNRNRNTEAEQELNATYVSFEELLSQSDVISVHANLSEQTKGIFNRYAFKLMKSSAIFINTARGGLHDEEDLREALVNGQIWGVGLDVTNPEPMAKDNPLLNMQRVCILPHIGSATLETRVKMAQMASENIVAVAKGKQMPQVLDATVYQ